MRNIVKEIRNWFVKTFETTSEYINHITKKNIQRGILVTLAVLSFSVINLLALVFKTQNNNNPEGLYRIIYQGACSAICLLCLGFFVFFRHTKNSIRPAIKNIPIYIALISYLVVCNFLFTKPEQNLNTFILMGIVSVVSVVYFEINPYIYSILVLIGMSGISYQMHLRNSYALPIHLNLIIFTVVVIILAFYKRLSSKQKYQNSKSLEAHTKALQTEISMAAMVQKAFYIKEVPEVKGWCMGYYSRAWAGVSGDLYDFYTHDNILDGVGVFDISGHGLSAGLVTMLVKNIISEEFNSTQEKSLEDTAYLINDRIIREKGELDNYLTGVMLKMKDDSVSMIAAGHPLPVIYTKATDTADFFINSTEERYGVLGMEDFPAKYVEEVFTVNKDDEIILYTDGLSECLNRNGDTFGKGRLLESIQRYIDLPVHQQIEYIINDLKSFVGEIPFNDDITLIILKKC